MKLEKKETKEVHVLRSPNSNQGGKVIEKTFERYVQEVDDEPIEYVYLFRDAFNPNNIIYHYNEYTLKVTEKKSNSYENWGMDVEEKAEKEGDNMKMNKQLDIK